MYDALKSFRERLSLSLADLSHVLGLSRSMLQKIENGQRSMNTKANFRLAFLLDHEEKVDAPTQVRLVENDEVRNSWISCLLAERRGLQFPGIWVWDAISRTANELSLRS
jgi:transcriptional regulator with XRE-family HTH domain